MGTRAGDTIRIRAIGLLTAVLASLSVAAPAHAYTVAPGWTATDYATGFPAPPSGSGAGPLGLAFDRDGSLFVSDVASDELYRIAPGGGPAAGSVIARNLGGPAGLTLGLDGRLYLARADHGQIDEIDPESGAVDRTVVTGLPCPTGLATDPLSGDLFASNKCAGGAIMRIMRPAFGASASTYTQMRADGLAFAPDGTLFAAAQDNHVDRIDGTGSASPGARSKLADVSEIDGIAYVPPGSDGSPAYLIVNRNDGEIDHVGLDGSSSPILAGASRGDLVTVGPDRCIYAAFQDRIVKLAPSTGNCTAAPPAGLAVLGTRATSRVVDLVLKGRAPKRIKRKARFTYVLKLTNRGPATAHKLLLGDQLAKGLRFVKVKKQRGVKCARRARIVFCAAATLAKRKTLTFRITVRATGGRRWVNHANVKSKDLDRAPANNRLRQITRVRRARHHR